MLDIIDCACCLRCYSEGERPLRMLKQVNGMIKCMLYRDPTGLLAGRWEGKGQMISREARQLAMAIRCAVNDKA